MCLHPHVSYVYVLDHSGGCAEGVSHLAGAELSPQEERSRDPESTAPGPQ